ncbi:MAG: polysaccharide deacetylase family protein [Bacteroidetes bacterium B1(2017)]|nr:MAG: polysaccharide deacetylase family protein [Bacteroidetes bacterium B1(2017)]
MFKYTIPAILHWLMPTYTWKVKTKDKQLFLTFDDGPHPQITPWVLALLKEYDAKATFFCVADNVKKFPETYKEVLNQGHTTGNHSFHHLNGWKTNTQPYLADVELASEYISSNLFRPPYGRIRRQQAKALQDKYKIIMWNRLSRDYEKNLNVNESLAQMKQVDNGSILVFHDSEKSFENLKVLLPELLSFYKQEGYQMLSIPNTLA